MPVPPLRFSAGEGATTPLPSPRCTGGASALAAGGAGVAAATAPAVLVIAPVPSVARLTLIALSRTDTDSGWLPASGSTKATLMALPSGPDVTAVIERLAFGSAKPVVARVAALAPLAGRT